MMTDNRWLSVDEIATYLGVKRDTIYKWIERKGMPANKVGQLWKFKLDEVDSWVRSGSHRDQRAGMIDPVLCHEGMDCCAGSYVSMHELKVNVVRQSKPRTACFTKAFPITLRGSD